MTPTYWENAMYTIRGDLIDLRKHITGLLDDVGFCAKRDAVQAIEDFDEQAIEATKGLKRVSLDRFRAAKREVRLHPQTAVVLCCAAGALTGWILLRALRAAPPAYE